MSNPLSNMIPPESTVQVRIMSAHNLRAVNLVKGNSDPYAAVSLLRTGETKTTPVCLNTVNPKWYHNLVFANVRPSDFLTIRLYDRNLMAGDVNLGTVEIALGEALSTSTAILSNMAHSQHSRPDTFAPVYSAPMNLEIPPQPPAWGGVMSENAAGDEFQPSAPPASPPASLYPSADEFSTSASQPPPPPEGGFYPTVDDFSMPAAQPPPPPEGSFYPTVDDFSMPASQPPPPPPPPLAEQESYQRLGYEDPLRATGSFHATMGVADVWMQRQLTREYSVASQGKLQVVIVGGEMRDLGLSAPKSHYKRFRSYKLLEHVGKVGKKGLRTKVGYGFGRVLNATADMVPPLQNVLESIQPVHAVFQEHSTWKIDMGGVLEVFGHKRHGWNREYPAARKIFQGHNSIIARKVVEAQHAYLYGGASGVKTLVNLRKDMMEKTGYTIDGIDFLELMEYGIRRGKPRIFTYVLMEHRLYMAETGATFFKDMMSKHAMHCSAATEVVYAGELHFRRAPLGSNEPPIRLIVDNNSGTYSPGKEDLPKCAEVFRRNFVGLHVTALDFKDPLLKQYQQELPPTTSSTESVVSS